MLDAWTIAVSGYQFWGFTPIVRHRENGFTWVDVSHLPLVPLFLDYRNNQISEHFHYTAKGLPAGEIVPPEVMGKYYPCGKYVNPMYFDCWDKKEFDSCCDDDYDDHDKGGE